jgi:hypothetical protein
MSVVGLKDVLGFVQDDDVLCLASLESHFQALQAGDAHCSSYPSHHGLQEEASQIGTSTINFLKCPGP